MSSVDTSQYRPSVINLFAQIEHKLCDECTQSIRKYVNVVCIYANTLYTIMYMLYMLYLLLFPITLKSVLKARNSIMVQATQQILCPHTHTHTCTLQSLYVQLRLFRPNPLNKNNPLSNNLSTTQMCLKKKQCKRFTKVMCCLPQALLPPCSPPPLSLSLTLFLGWAWLTCQPRQAVKQAGKNANICKIYACKNCCAPLSF